MKYLLLFSLLICGLHLQSQQAWTQKKGEGYLQVGISTLSYNSLHLLGSEDIDIPRPITETVLSSYLEYGISDAFTATFILPYHKISSGDLAQSWTTFTPEIGAINSLGNINIGITYNLYKQAGKVISSKINLGINSSKQEESFGLKTGYNTSVFSTTLLAGIGKSNYFASAETGFNFLSRGYLNQFVFNAQIGKHILNNKKMMFIFGITTMTSMGQSSDEQNELIDGNSRFTGLYVNDQSYYAINLKLGFKLTDQWMIWTSIAGGPANKIGSNLLYNLSAGYKI